MVAVVAVDGWRQPLANKFWNFSRAARHCCRATSGQWLVDRDVHRHNARHACHAMHIAVPIPRCDRFDRQTFSKATFCHKLICDPTLSLVSDNLTSRKDASASLSPQARLLYAVQPHHYPRCSTISTTWSPTDYHFEAKASLSNPTTRHGCQSRRSAEHDQLFVR